MQSELDGASERPIPWWSFAGAGFALLAVLLELLGSAWANSPAPAWTESVVPLAWPRAGRVVWWLAVAGAVGVFHLGAHRAGHRRHPLTVVVTVGPFAAFAVGILLGSELTTWH